MSKLARWRGVVALVRDAVEHGSRAVERVQLETAKRPFVVLEHIPQVAAPARIVHVLHDASVKTVHVGIRAVSALATKTVDIVLEQVDADDERSDPP